MQQFFRDGKWITWEEMVNLKRSEKEELNPEVISVTVRAEETQTEEVEVEKEVKKEVEKIIKKEVKKKNK